MVAISPSIRIAGLLAAVATGFIPVKVHAESSNSFNKETSIPIKPAPIAIPVTPLEQSAEAETQLQTRNTEESPTPPKELKLQADRQRYDARQERFIAEGRVKAHLNGGILQADRIEFDKYFNTLYARGSVRFRKGSQYFQASTLRYSLIQKEGELEDVYGVLDLDTAASELKSNSQTAEDSSEPWTRLPTQESESLGFPTALDLELNRKNTADFNNQIASGSIWDKDSVWDEENPPETNWLQQENKNESNMACPPVLPSIPDWHPHPWAVTAWGGQMIDSNFGDTFLFNGRMRPEYLLGLGLQKRIHRAGPFALELEADFFGHHANKQAGGEFNQSVPYADTPAQSFGEGVLGIGARLWVQPWLSFGFVQGISYNTANSNYERTYRENYAQLLNYLSFELEAAVSQQLSLVGRIHHRSGAFGTYSGVKEGSNAYLVGLRYRWGEDNKLAQQVDVPPPLGCPDPDRAS
ncbi:MAG TPA: DUF3769 domain-containing protein, partial [Prochlorococcus sp.]